MKTERRHELQTNKLSDVLGHQIEGLRPHATKLLAAGILGAVVVIAVAMIAKDRQSAIAQARNDLYLALAAQDREALESVAKTHSGTVVAWLAKVAQADIDLTNGLLALYINRDEAFQSLDGAKKAYTEVMNGATNNPDLVRHALFGLASAHEASSNLEKAREFYERVIQQFPDTPMATESRTRLEALKDPQTEKWYSWFARQTPKPRTSMPGMPNFSGMPGSLGELSNSPDFGPLTVPSANSANSPPSSVVPGDSQIGTKPNETGKSAEKEKTGSESKQDGSFKTESTVPPPESEPKPSATKPETVPSNSNSPSESKPPASDSTSPPSPSNTPPAP